MIKLVVSDMDGTLLDGNGNIPSEFRDLLPRLKGKGILFAVVSGSKHFFYYKVAKYGIWSHGND